MCAGGRVVIYGGAVACHNFALVDSLGHRIAPEVWKTPVQIFDNGSFDAVGNAQTGGTDPVADWSWWRGSGSSSGADANRAARGAEAGVYTVGAGPCCRAWFA